MTDTNVTFPRSSHPFEESNNPHAIFTTCLPLKLLIHTHPSPVTLQKDTYNAVPLKLWAQTTRLLPPLHITSRQNNNKRRTNGEANAPHKRSPIPLASLFSELVPPNRDPEQEPAAAHLPCPALRSERRCCCCCRASTAGHPPPGIHCRAFTAGHPPPPAAAAAAAAASGPAAGGAGPARPPREGSLAAAGRGSGPAGRRMEMSGCGSAVRDEGQGLTGAGRRG